MTTTRVPGIRMFFLMIYKYIFSEKIKILYLDMLIFEILNQYFIEGMLIGIYWFSCFCFWNIFIKCNMVFALFKKCFSSLKQFYSAFLLFLYSIIFPGIYDKFLWN